MKFLLVILTIAMSGCSAIERVAASAAAANDSAIESAEFTICSGASVGAIERRYNTVTLMKARREICKNEALVIK